MTQNEDKQNKNTTLKTQTMSNMDPTNKPGLIPGASEVYAFPVSNKTHLVLLIQSWATKLLAVI